MNYIQFNDKYSNYLEVGHYGLDIDNDIVVNYLDKIFPDLIEYIKDFKYSQIKLKFGLCRFYYSADIPFSIYLMIQNSIENDINNIIKSNTNK